MFHMMRERECFVVPFSIDDLCISHWATNQRFCELVREMTPSYPLLNGSQFSFRCLCAFLRFSPLRSLHR